MTIQGFFWKYSRWSYSQIPKWIFARTLQDMMSFRLQTWRSSRRPARATATSSCPFKLTNNNSTNNSNYDKQTTTVISTTSTVVLLSPWFSAVTLPLFSLILCSLRLQSLNSFRPVYITNGHTRRFTRSDLSYEDPPDWIPPESWSPISHHIYIYIYIHRHIYLSLSLYIYIYTSINTRYIIYLYLSLSLYIYIYTHILYTYKQFWCRWCWKGTSLSTTTSFGRRFTDIIWYNIL